MTNAERIRQMDDAELEELLVWRGMPDMSFVQDCDENCENYEAGCALNCPHENRGRSVRDWLQKEYGV